MSRLVGLYISAKKPKTEEEFMHDMREKEHWDLQLDCPNYTVRFEMYIGSGKNREHIQEEYSFNDLRDIYRRIEIQNKNRL
jgi:hypothetical protein